MPKRTRNQDQKGDLSVQEELKLVQSISVGSVTAWHEFFNRYSNLIYGVIRRHLFTEDEDELRSVYVDVLKSLHDGCIASYRGDASLATWLIVYTRNRSIDIFRKRHGSSHVPEGYKRLSEFDKKVMKLYFVEMLPLEIMVHMLRWSGYSANVDDIVESIQRIDSVIDRRYLKRLDKKHQARASGIDSVRMLEYLIQLRMEYEESSIRNRPDYYLMEKEVREVADRVRELISHLSPEERKVIFLRFTRNLSASKIAEKLKLGGQRRVYTIINKAIGKIRKSVFSEPDR
ncbi:MAG: sigma-70 family RNA polymerase sigma factor [bacterium]|nr:MAG: sigma-70 family RNA polymerase sigma factor [bacterium]